MKTVLVDERLSDKCERALNIRGFNVIRLPKDPDLGDAIASHPDTLLFFGGDEIITTADYCDRAAYVFSDIRESSGDIRISFTSDKRGKEYPNDCKMNALKIRENIFYNPKSVSSAITEYATRSKLTINHVSQGYPACTVLAFGSNAITADRGMAASLIKAGINVTLIEEGHIALPPYQYGFIGGASGVYENKVYFIGNIDLHPQREIIKSAIADGGFEAISLSDDPLTDLGGLVFI